MNCTKFSAQQDNTQYVSRAPTAFPVGTLQHNASSPPSPVFQVDAVVNGIPSRCLVEFPRRTEVVVADHGEIVVVRIVVVFVVFVVGA